MSEVEQLLHSLLLEVRGVRRLLERRDLPEDSPVHCALLKTISDIFGDCLWTCEEVLEEAEMGTDPEHAQLRACLADLGIANPNSLGNSLRSRIGQAAGGLELRRHDKTREGARRWSVRCD